MNSKAQVKGKLGHVVQIHVLPFAMNVTLSLSSIAGKSPLGESAGYTYVYRSYFLKKLWCYIDGAVKEKKCFFQLSWSSQITTLKRLKNLGFDYPSCHGRHWLFSVGNVWHLV